VKVELDNAITASQPYAVDVDLDLGGLHGMPAGTEPHAKRLG